MQPRMRPKYSSSFTWGCSASKITSPLCPNLNIMCIEWLRHAGAVIHPVDRALSCLSTGAPPDLQLLFKPKVEERDSRSHISNFQEKKSTNLKCLRARISVKRFSYFRFTLKSHKLSNWFLVTTSSSSFPHMIKK